MKNILSIFLLLSGFLLGCNEDKFPVSSLYSPGDTVRVKQNINDTVYVQQNPDWTGFNRPQAVIVGYEPFVYVADTYNDRIVMLDIAGRPIGYSQYIKHPVALAQDNTLHLLVCAEFDTLLPGGTTQTTFGAIYRLNLPAANHNIASIVPKRVFYEPGDSTRRYTAVATLYDNRYYIGRTGPKNTATMFDRDNAIILFGSDDAILSPVTASFQPDGTFVLSIHRVTALATMPTGKSVEFAFAQVQAAEVVPLLKVQWIRLITEGQTVNYASKFLPSTDGDIGLLQINKFDKPSGLVFDPSGNLYVVDAGTDSLYRFNSRGVERYSFGGQNDPYGRRFDEPSGIAYYDKTLFIADRGNNRICRYKLSIDMK